MQDKQIAKFMERMGYLDFGMISFGKPNKRKLLSQTLEKNSVPLKYNLSEAACSGILRRAERRGKKLPPMLEQALRTVATGTTNETHTRP